MADEGSSVWGAGDFNNETTGESSRNSLGGDTAKEKSAPRLFDDLGDAGWGSPEIDESTETNAVVEQVQPSLPDDIPSAPQADDVEDADFDDFDDGGQAAGDDDDFGDFGEFEEHGDDDAFAEEEVPQPTAARIPNVAQWRPLQLSTEADSNSIAREIRQLLSAPLADGREYPFHDGAASQLSQDKIRQVEGPSQLLVSDESRKIWSALTSQPNLQPVDWMRSKTRRQYLIAIGIPINLDELNTTSANGKALPPLALKLDGKTDGSEAAERGTENRDGGAKKGIGRAAKDRESTKPPEFDAERAKQVTALTEDQLTLQSLPALRTLMREVDTLTQHASKLLTFHLAQRENHAADAEMYNGLIRDLVTGAAKRVSASNTQTSGVARKASVRMSAHNQRASSGRNSPAVGVSHASVRSASPRN